MDYKSISLKKISKWSTLQKSVASLVPYVPAFDSETHLWGNYRQALFLQISVVHLCEVANDRFQASYELVESISVRSQVRRR